MRGGGCIYRRGGWMKLESYNRYRVDTATSNRIVSWFAEFGLLRNRICTRLECWWRLLEIARAADGAQGTHSRCRGNISGNRYLYSTGEWKDGLYWLMNAESSFATPRVRRSVWPFLERDCEARRQVKCHFRAQSHITTMNSTALIIHPSALNHYHRLDNLQSSLNTLLYDSLFNYCEQPWFLSWWKNLFIR